MHFLFPIILSISFIVPASAADVTEQYRDVQERIREQEKKLRQAKELEGSFLSQIDGINRDLDETRRDLRAEQAKIEKTKQRIQLVKDDISLFQEMLSKQRNYLKRKLSTMQRYGNEVTSIFTALVSSRDFAQMMRNIRYLKKVAEYDYRQITRYKENLQVLENKKKELGSLFARLKEEERDLKKQEDELNARRTHKEVLLASIRSQQEGYRRMLDELTEASNRLKEMLEEKETNTYQLTRFALLKGKLPWPVDGQVAIPYGSSKDPQYKTPVFRRGIYIKADEGMVAKSIYSGKVVFADWFKGYGKVIIINHGSGYHSVYANLNEIFIKSGDVVNKRDAIGRVGESGTISAPALYFEIRYKGKPLNPLQWLAQKG